MKRAFKWATLILILAEAALVRFNLLDIRTAIGIVVGVELLLLLVALRQVFVAVKTYRRDRSSGLDAGTALENGLEVFLPAKVARVLASELKLWFYLVLWVSRQGRRSYGDFTYHKKSILGPFLVLLLFTTPAEVFLIELLLPWTWLKWVLVIAAVYAFFWVVGLYASMAKLPHRLGESGIRLSYGIMGRADVPYANISGVARERNTEGLRGDGMKIRKTESAAYMAVGGGTDVVLRLRNPQALQGWFSATVPVETIHLAADEPERLVRELSSRVEMSGKPVDGGRPGGRYSGDISVSGRAGQPRH